jgi:hypothetical protein
MNHSFASLVVLLAAGLPQSSSVRAADNPSADGLHQFRTMLVGTLSLPDEEFLKFAESMKPEVIVMGAFGAPQFVAQEDRREWLGKWRDIFSRMHRSNIKVVGMIELLNVGNTPDEAMKFVDFFENHWDEQLLGRKPDARGIDLLEIRTMPPAKQSGAHAPRGCAVNPHWLSVEKGFVKAMIDAGIDGFITHRNMFGECGCPFCHAASTEDRAHNDATRATKKDESHKHSHAEASCSHCQNGFRNWLSHRFDKAGLNEKLGINNLAKYQLPAVYGHHRDHEHLPSALELEGMKYARHAIKSAYDDVFVDFGRSMKPDLLLAQWNHMPYFDELHLDGGHIPVWDMTTFGHASANERWSLPVDLWGKGEDFYWYCNWGTCQNTQLEKRFLADITLYAKLLRSFARGKPYVINKYDFYRPRNMMAEAAALGMMAGAIAVPYRTEEDRRVMLRYMQFVQAHSDLYADQNGQPVSDVLLVHPRTASHRGRADGLEMIEVAGRTMLTEHIQFDFVPDDLLSTVELANYKAVIVADSIGLETARLAEYQSKGGQVIAVPRTARDASDPAWSKIAAVVVSGLKPHTGGTSEAQPFHDALHRALNDRHARFTAPYTVEPHLYRRADSYVVHLVNYNHEEKASGRAVVEREAPIAAPEVTVRLPLGEGEKVDRVTFLDPDADGRKSLKYEQQGRTLSLTTPSFLTYGVCLITLKSTR